MVRSHETRPGYVVTAIILNANAIRTSWYIINYNVYRHEDFVQRRGFFHYPIEMDLFPGAVLF